MKNPWGIAFPPTGPFWISYNGAGVSTLYDGAGNAQTLFVTIPASTNPGATSPAPPTGVVFNGSATDFNVAGANTPARFIFAPRTTPLPPGTAETSPACRSFLGSDVLFSFDGVHFSAGGIDDPANGHNLAVTDDFAYAEPVPQGGGQPTINATAGVAFNNAVATFTDANPGAAATDFTGTVDWGDGQTSPAVFAALVTGRCRARPGPRV